MNSLLQSNSMEQISPSVNESDVAIIGMACRLPDANTLDEFWQNLRDGVESISHFSEQELLAEGHDANLIKRSNYVPARAILSDVEYFDASFFGYAPREAEVLDPQHRLFLECAQEALEHAGYGAQTARGRVGVYAGMSRSTPLDVYSLRNSHLSWPGSKFLSS